MGLKKLCLLHVIILFCACTANGQGKYNLDFEEYYSYSNMAHKWIEHGEYEVRMDSINQRSGKYSMHITSKRSDSILLGSAYYEIPIDFDSRHLNGKTIKLEGYIKTKNIQNGQCGLLLWARLGDNTIPMFENMEDKMVMGSSNWEKYSVTAPFPKGTESIFVGGYLYGDGETWFDDFTLTIDGNDIERVNEKGEFNYKANLDQEFDLGSQIEIRNIDDTLIDNLDLLGKIWGFLKYHHPKICEGNYNWDYELFRILSTFLKVKDKKERDGLIEEWIGKYGEPKKYDLCKTTSSNAFLKPDFSWMEDFQLNDGLKERLKHIYDNRCQDKQYYISLVPNVGNANFKSEDLYPLMSYPDDGFRLLSLYRLWNMVHYFFPYKYLIDKNWNLILAKYIPVFLHSKNKLEYELAVVKILGELNDTHAQLFLQGTRLDKMRGKFTAPFRIQFIENRWIVTDLYKPDIQDNLMVEIGDIITHINGKPIDKILDSIDQYYPASNEAARILDISKDLLRSNKERINIQTFSNKKGSRQFDIALYPMDTLNIRWYKDGEGRSFKLLEDNIGYISLKKVMESDVDDIKKTFAVTKGVIIDIRNYPSGSASLLLPYFIPSQIPYVKFTKPVLNNPGEFVFTDLTALPETTENNYPGKIVVLVNEETQSMAEYTAMAYRSNPNTIIIGSNTAGADGNVSSVFLPGGLQTGISGIGVYYPDGTETQRIGIVPDIEVKPTIRGIMEGRDEVLERAVEYILVE